jgi:hypothetical protein
MTQEEITYDWNFNPLDCYPTQSGCTNVVFNVHWQLHATMGSYQASSIGTQVVGLLDPGSFVSYELLTKEQVQGWVIDAMETLNPDSVNNLYNSLMNQIENQINPPISSITSPWINVPIPQENLNPVSPINL